MAIGNQGKFAMREQVYDFFKELAQIYLPAAGVLYAAVAGIYGLPLAVQVVGTIAALDTFLGVVLKVSSVSYLSSGGSADGSVHITDGLPSKLAIDLTPEQLANKGSIVLNVTGITQSAPAVTTATDASTPMTPGTFSQ